MRELQMECPCCGSNITIEIDDNFNIISVQHNEIEISENQLKDILIQNNIEFG